jgi:hypothetical protein
MKTTNEKLSKATETIMAATGQIREWLADQIAESMLARFYAMEDKLQRCGWDREAAFPYPGGNLSRADYYLAEAQYKFCRAWTLALSNVPRSPRTPDLCKARFTPEERDARIRALAKQQAEEAFIGFAMKLAAKFNALTEDAMVSAAYQGGATPMDYSRLTLCTERETLVFKTRIILNRSVYDKLFNQWPTRLESRSVREQVAVAA